MTLRRVLRPLLQPEWLFLLLALGLGGGLCFLLPVGAGFDETAHLTRAIEISTRQLIPNRTLNQQPLVPLVINEVTYRSKNFYTPVSPSFFADYKDRKIDWDIVFPKTTYSVYFPLLYFPQAALIWLARRLDWSVLGLYYACRLAECLGYALLCFFAIRLAPFGKWVLALLALAPTALLQAASISTDPYSNGAAFFFIAWVLALSVQEGPFTRRQVFITLLAAALLFSAKVNASALALLLLLLPRRKFPGARGYFLFLAAVAALFFVIVIAWNGYISLDFRVERADRGIWKQAAYIFSDPLGFIRMFFGDLLAHGREYAGQWIAVSPNFIGAVPPVVYPLYAGFLALTWISDSPARPLPGKTRWTLTAAFALSYLFAALFLYLGGRGPGDDISLNGRYLTLAAPAFFLGVIPPRRISILRRLSPLPVALTGAVTTAAAFMAGIYLTFYVSCGVAYYTPGLCYLPNYRNLDPSSSFTGPVTAERPVAQEFKAECPSIHSLMVWPQPAADSSGGQTTTFALRDAASGAVLASQTISNEQVIFGDWYEIQIPPVENAASRLFAIEISSTNPVEDTALSFSVSPIAEYGDGRLFIQGQEVDHDLYFHYGCRAGD